MPFIVIPIVLFLIGCAGAAASVMHLFLGATLVMNPQGAHIFAQDIVEGDTGVLCTYYQGEVCGNNTIYNGLSQFNREGGKRPTGALPLSFGPFQGWSDRNDNCFDFRVNGERQVELFVKGTAEPVTQPTLTLSAIAPTCVGEDAYIHTVHFVATMHSNENVIYASDALLKEGQDCVALGGEGELWFGPDDERVTCEVELKGTIELTPHTYYEWVPTEAWLPSSQILIH